MARSAYSLNVLVSLVATFYIWHIVRATPGLVPPQEKTELGCIPEGETVSYDCTVTDSQGIGATVWLGSAFNCPSAITSANNIITLSHGNFPSGAMGTCGGLTAMSVSRNGNEYTSRLTVMVTSGLEGTMINCTISNLITVGSESVRVGVRPTQPQPPEVTFISATSLTVSWPPSGSVVGGLSGYMFTVTNISGSCGCDSTNETVDADTTSVMCSDWTATACTFEVRALSQDCQLVSNPAEVTTVLSAPSPPSVLALERTYTCSFVDSSVNISWNASAMNANVPAVTSYRVRVLNFDERTSDGMTTTITIPGSSTPVFTMAGSYVFTVTAENPIGESQPVMETFAVAATSVSSVSTPSMTTAELTFTMASGCVGNAEITVYYAECADQSDSCQCPQDDNINANPFNAQVTMNPFNVTLDSLLSGRYYCYRSVVRNGGVVVGFENGQMFVTDRPEPPPTLPGAERISIDPPRYKCTSGLGRFNGDLELETIEATFDPGSGLYSVPQCQDAVVLIVVIVICLIIVLVGAIVVVAVIIIFCWKKKVKGKEDTEKLSDPKRKSPSPENPGLYADPNTIERQVAPGTSDEYAMVDRKGKKNKNPKPTQPEALYQDPNSIEHETAPSGDTYAVVDKPKRGSSKKNKEPDVVPGPSDGLNYADIDVAGSRHRPKPGSQRQAQQPGSSVEYSEVNYKTEENVASL